MATLVHKVFITAFFNFNDEIVYREMSGVSKGALMNRLKKMNEVKRIISIVPKTKEPKIERKAL